MNSSKNDTLTIGQLARRVGLRTSALRFYQEQGLLQPIGRTESGYRLYTPEAEQRLRFIQRAQRLGFSLADIRTLLGGWLNGDLSNEAIIETAEERYIALERQVTQLMVMQHELGLFLQDMHQSATQHSDMPADKLFERLLNRVCANPLFRPASSTLDLLMEHVGCSLTTSEGQELLDRLRGQHVHIWQEDEDYHILVISDDSDVGAALQALAELEAGCQAHAHTYQFPELMHNGEGFLLIVRGKYAFFFARLFLALQGEFNPLIGA
ncbi:MAG: MerR family transcriptional regulator [Anaerolineales bacterium]|nr:MAG: MerR family transcriptional regulator [Anaerolineales bacterium]